MPGHGAKAVVFDLFETLITKWGHEKYTKRKMTADLGCPLEEFSRLWEALHEKQYRGEIGFEESIRLVCGELGVSVSEAVIRHVTERRIQTKGACFAHIRPDIFPMLQKLRGMGYKLAILSNCSEEEVALLRESELAELTDELILSYETGLCKPQPEIYRLTAERLGVSLEDCIFVGDGGSRELYGAAEAGMTPYRAMWYIRQMPAPIVEQPGFSLLESPEDMLTLL